MMSKVTANWEIKGPCTLQKGYGQNYPNSFLVN